MTELQINPLFQNALRPLEPDEYERLSKSIEAEGCHTPLMTWNGYIIAGHNRYQICRETGQSFRVENRDADFENETDVLIWILDDALAGRNLNFVDKKLYIGELYNLTKQRDSDRAKRLSDKSVTQGDTSINIGSKFGVSGRTVKRYGTEAERQKLMETLKIQVQKEAMREDRMDDEEWQADRFNELSNDLQEDATEEFGDEIPQDEFSQVEKVADRPPKRRGGGGKAKTLAREQKAALRAYSGALDKLQGLRLGLLFGESIEPDYKACYAWIAAETDRLPQPKKRFGR